MTLSLHSEVEDLTNLLHLRRTASAQRRAVAQAYLNFAATLLDVPAPRLVETLPAPVVHTQQPVALRRAGASPRRAA